MGPRFPAGHLRLTHMAVVASFPRVASRDLPQCASSCHVSSYVTVNAPLNKASHVARPRVSVRRNYTRSDEKNLGAVTATNCDSSLLLLP